MTAFFLSVHLFSPSKRGSNRSPLSLSLLLSNLQASFQMTCHRIITLKISAQYPREDITELVERVARPTVLRHSILTYGREDKHGLLFSALFDTLLHENYVSKGQEGRMTGITKLPRMDFPMPPTRALYKLKLEAESGL